MKKISIMSAALLLVHCSSIPIRPDPQYNAVDLGYVIKETDRDYVYQIGLNIMESYITDRYATGGVVDPLYGIFLISISKNLATPHWDEIEIILNDCYLSNDGRSLAFNLNFSGNFCRSGAEPSPEKFRADSSDIEYFYDEKFRIWTNQFYDELRDYYENLPDEKKKELLYL
jgi:hypothetical protein